ncbi:hypothetical protein [Listeria sp. PSOL-1]|uniref:hypothetical protein n=1 Tax=Listeria sp. PSOL-1 TaxID=1844999 RepID=UPI0013D0AA74|nr:hypothetical protein [Listeria sp. PSOL-1]
MNLWKKIIILFLLILSGVLSLVISYKQAAPYEFNHFLSLIHNDVKFKFLAVLLVIFSILVIVLINYILVTIIYYLSRKILKIDVKYNSIFYAESWFMILTAYQFIIYIFVDKNIFITLLNPLSIIGLFITYFMFKKHHLETKDAMTVI